MTGYTDLSALYDEPLDPAAMDFTTKPGRACICCLFRKQRISVCNRAVELALRAGQDSCDVENVVYVHKQRDPRQLSIEVAA